MTTYPRPTTPHEHLPELLRPVIEKYRDEADELRRLPDELVEQLRTNGAFRLNTPTELGGYELPVASTVSLVERLARLDGPTAWNVWNLNAGFAAAFLPEADAEMIFADGPDPMIAHSSQPGMLTPAEDGFMLSGEWRLVSGVHGAKWLALLTILLEDGQPRMTETGPDVRFCLVPREAVEVRDTWHSLGMRGTDSNTVIAQNVPVKDTLALKLDTKSRIDRPLFRLPMVNQITSGGAAVVLGIARAAIDEVVALSLTKTGMDGAPLAHQPHIQSAIGRAVAQVDAARGLLLSTLGGLDAAAAENRASSEAERGAVRSALSYAGEIGRAVITAMYELSSSTGVYESSRLSKLFRDGHVAAQHATLAPAQYALAGRTVIGLPANDPNL